MSRNEDRLGAKLLQNNTIEEVISKEPSLSFSMPSELVELPSKGKYYPEGSPLKNMEMLEIRFMTAKQEDILTSKSLLKKGVAIDRMLQSLIVNPGIKVDDLLIGDKNALVIASRISGYGAEYKTKITCTFCDHKFDHVFDLGEIKTKGSCENIDSSGLLTFTLPKTKAVVRAKLLTGHDEKFLGQLLESKRKSKLAESALTDQLKMMIISVNDNVDKNYISKFVETMPSLDSRYLRTEYYKSVPDIDISFTIVCPECDSSQEVSMPLGQSFFWPE